MFSRLDKFDGPIIRGAYIQEGEGVYIRGVNWVTYLGNVYSEGGRGGILTGFYGIYFVWQVLSPFLLKQRHTHFRNKCASE